MSLCKPLGRKARVNPGNGKEETLSVGRLEKAFLLLLGDLRQLGVVALLVLVELWLAMTMCLERLLVDYAEGLEARRASLKRLTAKRWEARSVNRLWRGLTDVVQRRTPAVSGRRWRAAQRRSALINKLRQKRRMQDRTIA